MKRNTDIIFILKRCKFGVTQNPQYSKIHTFEKFANFWAIPTTTRENLYNNLFKDQNKNFTTIIF